MVVALVGRPHGVRGELRLAPTSARPERLAGLSELWIVRRGAAVEEATRHRVVGSRTHGHLVLVRLEDVNDRDAASALTQGEAWARRGELPPWGPDEFGVEDVVGLTLLDGDREVGVVRDLVANAGRDFLEVEHEGRVVLVPAVKDWLVEWDRDERRLTMRLPAGLLDE